MIISHPNKDRKWTAVRMLSITVLKRKKACQRQSNEGRISIPDTSARVSLFMVLSISITKKIVHFLQMLRGQENHQMISRTILPQY